MCIVMYTNIQLYLSIMQKYNNGKHHEQTHTFVILNIQNYTHSLLQLQPVQSVQISSMNHSNYSHLPTSMGKQNHFVFVEIEVYFFYQKTFTHLTYLFVRMK